MIGNLIEQQFLMARNWPFGSALAMVLLGAVLIFLLLYVAVVTRSEDPRGQQGV
jgi:spermidine/putrescine transport system permease protein